MLFGGSASAAARTLAGSRDTFQILAGLMGVLRVNGGHQSRFRRKICGTLSAADQEIVNSPSKATQKTRKSASAVVLPTI
jgi:hypothetical protein